MGILGALVSLHTFGTFFCHLFLIFCLHNFWFGKERNFENFFFLKNSFQNPYKWTYIQSLHHFGRGQVSAICFLVYSITVVENICAAFF